MAVRNEARAIAEHEASHAIVAWAHGVYIASMKINPRGFGGTLHERASPIIEAAISAAGDVWDREFADQPYRDGSCADLIDQLERVGTSGIWLARRTARGILTAQRREVINLAARLRRERQIVFT